jgi:lysophospholipase L1-like esterase
MKQLILILSLFTITIHVVGQNCSNPLKIVVLGSSTAWGNGLPSRDSAWTFRYARYLKQYHNKADTVILLAIGGYTTQHIMPTGTPPYTVLGNTFLVDTTHNITWAIALHPDAIIINMPTNDEARGFPLDKQTANFLVLKREAALHHIPLWVSTTQPRSNLGYTAALHLAQMKDTILHYFGAKAIDFWTGLALANGFIDPAYNSGDGVHLNAAGQRILFERVVAKHIPDVLCGGIAGNDTTGTQQGPPPPDSTYMSRFVFPNPATDYLVIPSVTASSFVLEVYNTAGTRLLSERRLGKTTLNVGGWAPGVYFIIIKDGKDTYRTRMVKI